MRGGGGGGFMGAQVTECFVTVVIVQIWDGS